MVQCYVKCSKNMAKMLVGWRESIFGARTGTYDPIALRHGHLLVPYLKRAKAVYIKTLPYLAEACSSRMHALAG